MTQFVAIAMMLLLGMFAAGLGSDLVDEWYDREVKRIYSAAPDDGAFPYPALVL